MTNDVKAYILYEYIVGNQPTTNGKLIQSVCSKYGVRGMSDTDYEMVFREYNINYDDIARGKKGGRGQHLGKYKNGYRNNKGKVCSVTLDVIKEYMNSYKRTQKNLEEFLALNGLLKDFKAVQNGNVWCTNRNMYQSTMQLGQMIQDFNIMLTTEDPSLTELNYLYKLQ